MVMVDASRLVGHVGDRRGVVRRAAMLLVIELQLIAAISWIVIGDGLRHLPYYLVLCSSYNRQRSTVLDPI